MLALLSSLLRNSIATISTISDVPVPVICVIGVLTDLIDFICSFSRNRNITLDNYIDFLTKFPLEELQVKDIKRSNLTKEEHNALQELRGDPEILIFEADKGGAVVIMDSTYYADKIFQMLHYSQTYEELTANKDKNVMKLIKELAGNHSHSLTEKEVNYVCHFDFKPVVSTALQRYIKAR